MTNSVFSGVNPDGVGINAILSPQFEAISLMLELKVIRKTARHAHLPLTYRVPLPYPVSEVEVNVKEKAQYIEV
jgi:hypothetical protein